MNYYDCPACSSEKVHAFRTVAFDGAKECTDCGAVFGYVEQEVFDRFVKYDNFLAGEEAAYYFHFTIGNESSHGWCDKHGQCVQTG